MPSDASPAITEVEQGVLGACLLHVGSVDMALSLGITRESFALPGHQAIWRALEQWHVAPQTGEDVVDVLLLWEQIRRNQDENKLAGLSDLCALQSRVTFHEQRQIRARCAALREWELRRRTWAAAHRLQQLSGDPSQELGALSDVLDATLGALQGDVEEAFTSSEAAGDDLAHWLHQQEGKEGPLGLSTGFWEIDQLTDGFAPGDLVILAGRPGTGKSAMAWQIAEHVAERHGPVPYFSLEMGHRLLMLRALMQHTHLPAKEIAAGRLEAGQKRACYEALARLQCLPLHLDTRGSLSPAQFRARCRLLHRRTPLKLIVVDYLQLMRVQAENREQEVAMVSRALKGLAMELQVPVLACTQMNRSTEYRTGKDRRPRLSDLRDSGQIEQDADIITFLYHDDGVLGTCEAIVAKHRDGPTGSVGLKWESDYAAFADRAPMRAWRAA